MQTVDGNGVAVHAGPHYYPGGRGGDERVAPEFLAGVHVGDVALDQPELGSLDGIVQCERGVGVGTGLAAGPGLAATYRPCSGTSVRPGPGGPVARRPAGPLSGKNGGTPFYLELRCR